MFRWAARSKNEVGGVMKVEQYDNTLFCHSPVVIPQVVPLGNLQFRFDPEALMKWQEENITGAFEQPGMPYATWGIWHSHADAGVGWSNLDHELIDDHGTRGLLVNIVVNKRRAVYSRVDCYAGGITLKTAFRVEVPSEYMVASVLDQKTRDWADELFDQCVTYEEKPEPWIIKANEPPRQAGFTTPSQAVRAADYSCTKCGLGYQGCTKANHYRKKRDKHTFTPDFRRGRAAAAERRELWDDDFVAPSKAPTYQDFTTDDQEGYVRFFTNGCVKVFHDSWVEKGLDATYVLTGELWDEIRKLLPQKTIDKFMVDSDKKESMRA